MAEMLGYNVEEMTGAHISKFIDKKLLKRTKKILKNPTEVLKQRHDFEFVRNDGSKIQTIIETSPIKNEECNDNGLLAMVTDITDRINAEKEIKRANIYRRGLIESSLDPMVTIGHYDKISDVNNATERFTGYSRNKLIGTDFSEYITDPEKAKKGFQKVLAEGKMKNYELEIKHKDGKITPVSYNASIYTDENGEVIGIFAAARDITEIKKAKKTLSLHLREKEVLLREIHHESKTIFK